MQIAFLLVHLLTFILQTPAPAILTVSSVISRLEGSPLQAESTLAELGQFDTSTGLYSPATSLWGANAPLYASWTGGIAWSGKRMALTYRDPQQRWQIAIYHADDQTYDLIIPEDRAITNLSQATWTRTGLLFSGEEDGVFSIYRANNRGLEILGKGKYPAFREMLAFVNDDNNIQIENGEIFELEVDPITHLIWTPDGNALTFVAGKKIMSLEIDSGQTSVIFDAAILSGESIPAIAWSPDGYELAFTVTGSQFSMLATYSEGKTYIQMQRRFDEVQADPRVFLDVAYQPPATGSNTGDF